MACVSFVQAQGLTTYTILNEFNDDGVPPGSGVRPLFEFNAWALDEPALFQATSGSILFYGSFEIQPQSVVKLTMPGGQAFDLNSVNLDRNEGRSFDVGFRPFEIYPGVFVRTDPIQRAENGVMIVRASDGTTQEVTRRGEIDFDIRAVEWVEFISVSAKLHIKGFTFATSEDYQPALKAPAINESQRAPTMQELISSQDSTTELDAAIAERDAAIAERDAAFALLETSIAETDAAIAERDARPTTEALVTVQGERDAATAQRDAAIAERDARPTTEALVTVQGERDAILADIQLAYDEVTTASGATEEDLIAVAPTSSATIFDLVWTNSGDPADTIEMTIEFPEGTVRNPLEVGFGPRRPTIGTVLTIDYQGTVTVINSPRMSFNSPVELDFSQELMGQNGFGDTAGSPGSGDFNLFGVEVPEGTFRGVNYFTLSAPDGSRYTLTSMLAPVVSRFSSLELNPLTELYTSLVAANEEAIAERDTAIADRDARPTAEQLAAVEAERDARFTEDQIRGLSADYTIGLNEAGNVQMKFNLFESADLSTFAPLTVSPDSVSVVDGTICLEFAPEDRAAFFRFNVE